ncbi:hypothetical protein J1N35_040233 [Gossypium stocksii]|uniref:Uncharacterized protein n=1 Tax=Gossypium stocksii TaxID=47602 RepID=A0A9D3UD98_9ROSI|nr:hypothetical protein J1N35_040233 [Gossypium stocksii]
MAHTQSQLHRLAAHKGFHHKCQWYVFVYQYFLAQYPSGGISNHQTYAGLLEMVLKGDIKFDLHYRALRRPPSLQLEPPRQYVLATAISLTKLSSPERHVL